MDRILYLQGCSAPRRKAFRKSIDPQGQVQTGLCPFLAEGRLFHAVLSLCFSFKTIVNTMYGLKFCNCIKDFLFLTDI